MDATPLPPRPNAAEILSGKNLSGRRMVITGAASGIGAETMKALAEAGAEVVLAVRDTGAAAALAGPLNSRLGRPAARVEKLDLASPRSIADFAARAFEAGDPIDVLINNAGVMACPLARTEAGWEMQFGVNHFGHFLLTLMLAPLLEAAAQESGRGARVVSLSSIAHRRSPIHFDDIHYERRAYDKWEAYGQSKTANALFAVGFTRRFAAHGVTANAVMPGGILTPLQRHLPKEEMIGFGWIDAEGRPNPRMKTPAQGAATSVWAATAAELEGMGGLYLEDCAIAQAWRRDDPWVGVMPHALDPEAAERLWRVSEEAVGFTAAV